jgi:predicted nucleic acid-binding protein
VIVCDTGPLVAALNRKDADHERCVALLEGHLGPLLVPGPVLTEVCYLLENRHSASISLAAA